MKAKPTSPITPGPTLEILNERNSFIQENELNFSWTDS
jgi:hypothetical protein